MIRYYQKGNMAKYVIGYFGIQASYAADKMPGEDRKQTPLNLYNTFGSDMAESIEATVDADTLKRIVSIAHSKRNEDHYFIAVGDPSDAVLLTHAIKLTENGFPFEPNQIGRECLEMCATLEE